MSPPEISKRDFLKLANEGLKALFPPYGIGSDLIISAKTGEPHVSPGTAIGVALRLKGDIADIARPWVEIPWGDAENLRCERRIKPFLTDYAPDQDDLSLAERIEYYRLLNTELGINQIRTEFRMSDLINSDQSFNETTVNSYLDSLIAMREAGFEPPILVLFTPAEWMLEFAQSDPEKFSTLYRNYAEKIVQLCQETDTFPSHVQVMNEINTSLQNKLSLDQIIDLIGITHGLFKTYNPSTKIMTTILTEPSADWQEYTQGLISQAGDKLDTLGFDYYPCYAEPFDPYLPCQDPFEIFTDTSVYEWIAQEKIQGILQPFEVMLAETGAQSWESESRLGRLQYDRTIQVLDHFLLDYQRQGHKAEEIFSSIGFFAGGDWPAVVTKAPFRLDFTPFTLLRQTNGNWETTLAGKRLKYLIETRLKPPPTMADLLFNSALTLINSSFIINSQ